MQCNLHLAHTQKALLLEGMQHKHTQQLQFQDHVIADSTAKQGANLGPH